MTKKRAIENKQITAKPYINVLAVFSAICVLITLFCFRYYKNLSTIINDESKVYLQEIAFRIGNNIDRIVIDNYSVLHTMSTSVESIEEPTLSDVQQILKKQSSFWNYQTILLIDKDGKAYNLNNEEVFLSLDSNVRSDILGSKQTMTPMQIINNTEYIVFSVPLKDTYIEGKTMVALAGCYSPNSFNQTLSMSSFNDKSYSQIISNNGSVIIPSSYSGAIKTGYNVFSTIKSAKFYGSDSLQNVEKDIGLGKSGQIRFDLDGDEFYMVYTPIQPKNWYMLTFVPVEVVNAKSDILLKSTMYISGIIALAFAGLCATLTFVFNSHRRKLEHLAYVDEITGGHTIQRFYQLADETLSEATATKYAIIYTNVEKFKVMNEQIGRHNCDNFLKFFYLQISQALTSKEHMGRLTADNFCAIVEYTDEESICNRISKWHQDAELHALERKLPWSIPVVEFGIYIIEDYTLTFPQMIDRAKLALKETTWRIESKMHCAFYNDRLRRQLMRDKKLEDNMEKSLQNGEFIVYLQPKYYLPTDTIEGAEALVRWNSSFEGMIYPDEFIPLFEKNGFIINIDLHVFEEVCKLMEKWQQQNLRPIKVSVNLSRVHLKNINFVDKYIKIAEKYNICRNLVEIELTESIVLDSGINLIQIIEDIKNAGFCCSMDDFGSGYSSLNLIQSLPVDTLKLDRIFFKNTSGDAVRTEAVIKSIITMAKELSMDTVAEGVEIKEQVHMLRNNGCDYIQGYVYAKPMPILNFEELAFNDQLEK